MTQERVVITGVGVVNAAVTGGSAALGAYLAAPRWLPRHPSTVNGASPRTVEIRPSELVGHIDEGEARRLSRICQLTVAAGRLALADAGLDSPSDLGLVVGSEFGDLRSTREFVDGYLDRGPGGLSALLFPNTVMNTMAATTAIAVAAKAVSLTLTAPTVAGELAVARAAAMISAGRREAVLAGGVDQLEGILLDTLAELGAGVDLRGEGATFLLLESLTAARGRGARVLGEIVSFAWNTLAARPWGIGRSSRSRAIAAALRGGETTPTGIGWVYTSASGDGPRDAWEDRLLRAALGREPPPMSSLTSLLGHHAGLGALRVAAAAWTSQSGWLPQVVEPRASGGSGAVAPVVQMARVTPGPGLVHGLARGGTNVALVVAPPPESP